MGCQVVDVSQRGVMPRKCDEFAPWIIPELPEMHFKAFLNLRASCSSIYSSLKSYKCNEHCGEGAV